MLRKEIKIRYIGGPTALLEIGNLRLLTDPTFDPKDTFYDTGLYVLHKKTDPLISVKELGKIDYVLLTHDHHFDNLDNLGRMTLDKAVNVFTTEIGAKRLGKNAIGLKTWQEIELPAGDGRTVKIIATPCRHGPANADRGPVTGFLLNFSDQNENWLYITGDTVWYEGIEEVARRFNVGFALLFLGAAVVKNVGSAHLTMTVDEGILFAEAFKKAILIPMHFEGWEHFTQSKNEIREGFKKANLLHRLQWSE